MSRTIIQTDRAPQAIGTYSQAVRCGNTVYLSGQFLPDLGHFTLVNEIMAEYFNEPYPARAAVGVAALPKGAQVEMDAVMELDDFDEDEYLDQ
jgi:enamine deaminase RidA (YjgF/YER057c/UK114 family)